MSWALLLAFSVTPCYAQGSNNPSSTGIAAKTWAQDAAQKQMEIIEHADSFLRYKQRTVDSRKDELREVIESKDGTVARLLMRDNRALTVEEDSAERDRLAGLLEHPADFRSHISKEAKGKKQAFDLIRLMPDAMIYIYAPDQTPAPAGKGPQVVIDYAPNPKFNAPTTESQALSGLRGRIWIDVGSKTIVQMNADIFQGVNFGWGLLAHIFPGGKLDFEQTNVIGSRWNMTSLHEHMTVKALLVKTITFNSEVHLFDFQSSPTTLTYQDAVHALLDTPLPK